MPRFHRGASRTAKFRYYLFRLATSITRSQVSRSGIAPSISAWGAWSLPIASSTTFPSGVFQAVDVAQEACRLAFFYLKNSRPL